MCCSWKIWINKCAFVRRPAVSSGKVGRFFFHLECGYTPDCNNCVTRTATAYREYYGICITTKATEDTGKLIHTLWRSWMY